MRIGVRPHGGIILPLIEEREVGWFYFAQSNVHFVHVYGSLRSRKWLREIGFT